MVGVVVQVVDLIWRYWVVVEGSEGDLSSWISDCGAVGIIAG